MPSRVQAQVGFGMFLSTTESAQSITKALLGNLQGGVDQILQDLQTLGINFGSASSAVEGLGQALSQVGSSVPQVPNSLNGGLQTVQIGQDFRQAFQALQDYPNTLKALQGALQNALSNPSKALDPTASLQNLQQNLKQPLDNINNILQPTTKSLLATEHELEQNSNNLTQKLNTLKGLFPTGGAWTNTTITKSVDNILKALNALAADASQSTPTLHPSQQAQQDLAKALGDLNALKGVADTLWGINSAGAPDLAQTLATGITTTLKKMISDYQDAQSALKQAQNTAAQATGQVALLKQVGGIVANLKNLQGLEAEANNVAKEAQSINGVLQEYTKQYDRYSSTFKGIGTSIQNISQEITQAYNYAYPTGKTKEGDLALCASTSACLNGAIKALESVINSPTNRRDVAGLQTISQNLRTNTSLTGFNANDVGKTLTKLIGNLTSLQNISTALRDMQTINTSGNTATSLDLKNTIQAIEGVQDVLHTINAQKGADTIQTQINSLDQPDGALNQSANTYDHIMIFLETLLLPVKSALKNGSENALGFLAEMMPLAVVQVQQAYIQYQHAQTAIQTACADTNFFIHLPVAISNALNTTTQDLQNFIKTLTDQDITQTLQQANANALVHTAQQNYKNATDILANVANNYGTITRYLLPMAQGDTTASQQEFAKAQALIKEIEQALTGYQNALKTPPHPPP
ncbi:hypothetical protein, partial [Helicobacter heilmannii]|uniref:hypothetical protein n=1 Tax=Helicobacter heilmannii TaxID=35817 RepID=UPI0012E2EA11